MRVLGLLLVALGFGCSHRAVVVGNDDARTSSNAGPAADGFILPPATGTADVCGRGQVLVSLYRDPRGNFTLAHAPSLQAAPVSVAAAGSQTSAAAVGGEGVAALVVTRASRLPLSVELDLLGARLAQVVAPGSVAQRSSGTAGTSHDGFNTIQQATWDLVLDGSTSPCQTRNLLLAAVLDRPPTEIASPPCMDSLSTEQVVQLSLVQRTSGQIAVTAAVADRAALEHPGSALGARLDDLANGTALAGGNATTEPLCDEIVAKGLPEADIIWVVDESGSMDDNRKDIVDNATLFFGKAKSAGLDFRVGVTGVVAPNGSTLKLGKLCSAISTKSDHDGGEDRFLLPHEGDLFAACVENPPHYEGGQEYGLLNARFAVERHLPRAAGDSRRIRPGAQLVLIVATDEVPQSLSELIGDGYYRDCTLPAGKQAAIAQVLAAYLDLFSGKSDPEARATLHVIGGACNNSCTADVAHGYRELAQQLKGQVGDVCQPDLGATLQAIVDGIIGSASPLTLSHTPISATLAVNLAGQRIPRGVVPGFSYNPAHNSLAFLDIPVSKGQGLTVSYRRFVK